MHCNGNSVYIFLFGELRGLSPNFHIHVSVSDLYIPWIGPHISYSRKGRPMVGIYNSLTDTWMWKLGLRPRYSFSGNICFKFSAFCLCSVVHVCQSHRLNSTWKMRQLFHPGPFLRIVFNFQRPFSSFQVKIFLSRRAFLLIFSTKSACNFTGLNLTLQIFLL